MGVDEYGEPLSNTHSHTDEMISDDTFLRVLCPRDRDRVESDATSPCPSVRKNAASSMNIAFTFTY